MYKYRINELLNSLPPSMSIEKFGTKLKTIYNISSEVFHVDRFLKLRERTVIPKDRLEKYARAFNVPVQQLYAKEESTQR